MEIHAATHAHAHTHAHTHTHTRTHTYLHTHTAAFLKVSQRIDNAGLQGISGNTVCPLSQNYKRHALKHNTIH